MLDGAVNSQNRRIWSSACPYILHEHSLHLDYITVWCQFTDDSILGPFFLLLFEQNTSHDPPERLHHGFML